VRVATSLRDLSPSVKDATNIVREGEGMEAQSYSARTTAAPEMKGAAVVVIL